MTHCRVSEDLNQYHTEQERNDSVDVDIEEAISSFLMSVIKEDSLEDAVHIACGSFYREGLSTVHDIIKGKSHLNILEYLTDMGLENSNLVQRAKEGF